jgi:Ca2+-binding EF-hand superfamily protein
MMRALPVLNALDADDDGTLSSSEIAAASEALKKLDKNSDGKLSPEEMRPDFPPRGAPFGRFGPGGFGDRRGPGPFGRGDRPGDGGERLSAEQLTESLRAMVMRADTNRDGFISGDEMIVALRGAAEDREDRDEADERRPSGRGRDFGPGRGPEAQRGQPPRRGMGGPPDPDFVARMFEMRDRDGDGKLKGDEIPDPISERLSGRMEEVDSDGDGSISKQELERVFARMREGFSGRGPRGRGPAEGAQRPGGDLPRRPQPEE